MENVAACALLRSLLGLKSPPVAVAFADTPPPELSRVALPAVSGCTYWKLAADGSAFYTQAEDHFGCPVGAHTHNVPLPPAKQQELQDMVGTMVQLEYIRLEEIPQIPRRRKPMRVACYAPLDAATFAPDAVLVRGNARAVMLLSEAASAAAAPVHHGVMGRPTCAFIPMTADEGQAAASAGCIGNRVYTGLRDDEMYFSIPGSQLDAVLGKLEIIARANDQLEKFHMARMAT